MATIPPEQRAMLADLCAETIPAQHQSAALAWCERTYVEGLEDVPNPRSFDDLQPMMFRLAVDALINRSKTDHRKAASIVKHFLKRLRFQPV